MPTDDELLASIGRALDEGPATPPTDRIDALRARAAAAQLERRHPPSTTAASSTFRPPPTVRSRWNRTAVLTAAAAAIAVVLGFTAATVLDRNGSNDVAGTVEYSGSMLAPDGSALDANLTVVATGIGRVVELDTDVLPILPTHEYYQVWFVGPGDSPSTPNRISAGTFHPDRDGRSNVRFAAAVDPTLYARIEITAEPGDGNPQATGPVVLSTKVIP